MPVKTWNWISAVSIGLAALGGCSRPATVSEEAVSSGGSAASTATPAASAGPAAVVGAAKSETSGAASIAGQEVGKTGTEKSEMTTSGLKKATFGAGCFWGVEETFRHIDGVANTAVGYMGGGKQNPTYKDVCTDETGHAEVVHVEYDPAKVTYEQLLDVFWKSHNPTTLNRQGPDIGRQYRSAVFFYDAEQEATAKASKEKLTASGKFNRPIVTEITRAGEFWRAEEYHQQYLAKRGIKHCPSTVTP